jgi:putative ABC transport system permease protein
MLRNYIKIALRNLFKNKIYSLVNIISLTLGLAVMLLVSLYVKDDLSFDRFHQNGNQIYRLVQNVKDIDGNEGKMGNTGLPQGKAFKDAVPEIKDFCRFKNGWNTLVQKGNEGIKEKLMYADPSALTMFSFEVIEGNKNGALNSLNGIVISKKTKEKYFEAESAVGKVLNVGDEGSDFKPFVVTAVLKDIPQNSSIQFDLLLPIEHIIPNDPQQRANQESWYNASLNTFMLLDAQANIGLVEKKMAKVSEKYIAKSKKESSHLSKYDAKFLLQPFFKMHLDPEYYATNGMEYWSDIRYPKILSSIALLILIIACINFINLTLARSLKRTKEIGIRKTNGSTNQQLLLQFLGESFILTLVSAVPAIFLAQAFLPMFSELTDKHLDLKLLFSKETIAIFIALIIVVSVLAGFYPAVVMSRFQPIKSLKGQLKLSNGQSFGEILIVFQFMMAGVLISATFIAARQFDFIANKDLGYKTDNIIRFWLPWEQIGTVAPKLKHELSQLPLVEKVSAKSGDWNSTMYEVEGVKTEYTYYEYIDENHLQLLQIPLLKGRYLSSKYSLDTVSNIIVNEAFVKKYVPKGIDPFSAKITQHNSNMSIVGIVKDFHYASFKEDIKPIVWGLDTRSQAGCLHVQIAKNQQQAAIESIKKVYKKYVPYLPIEYQSLEDFRMEKYAEDIRWKKVLNLTSFVAILIAFLGLFGLATFSTEQRTKEIGIRKVLGASITSITTLLAKDFIKLIFIAIIVASPIAYYFMSQWLQDFVYRIDISWWFFALSAILIITIALLTVSYQAIRAALMNPVKSLKTE